MRKAAFRVFFGRGDQDMLLAYVRSRGLTNASGLYQVYYSVKQAAK